MAGPYFPLHAPDVAVALAHEGDLPPVERSSLSAGAASSKIVFTSNRPRLDIEEPFQDYDLFVMNADGSGKRRLTRTRAGEEEFACSPDGQSIAFESWRGADLYVINAHGSGQRNLRGRRGRVNSGSAGRLGRRSRRDP